MLVRMGIVWPPVPSRAGCKCALTLSLTTHSLRVGRPLHFLTGSAPVHLTREQHPIKSRAQAPALPAHNPACTRPVADRPQLNGGKALVLITRLHVTYRQSATSILIDLSVLKCFVGG